MFSFFVGVEYPDDCISHPCKNGGTCHSSSGVFSSCTCALGFTGTYCHTSKFTYGSRNLSTLSVLIIKFYWIFLIFCLDINNCQPNPCSNGGTCVDGVNDHYCICTPYYTGPSCGTSKTLFMLPAAHG